MEKIPYIRSLTPEYEETIMAKSGIFLIATNNVQ